MSYIMDGLYMGDGDDAYNSDHLRDKLNVTHILTLDIKPLTIEAKEGFTYKYVNALDTESTDLLSEIEDCNTFITEGREAGGVLVHCVAGMSCSGTIVVAYVMQKMDLSFTEALDLVKCQRPQTRPNAGFMEQLELYNMMGRRVDKTMSIYKSYRLAKLAEHIQIAQCYVPQADESLGLDPTESPTVSSQTVYKCRKCRRSLFRADSVIEHEAGAGEETFTHPWLVQPTTEHKPCTDSLFTEPMSWMKSQLHGMEGKLSCPKCSAKLGSFNWCGERCQCGQWICPAFHISTSKVDECKPRVQRITVPAAATGATTVQNTNNNT